MSVGAAFCVDWSIDGLIRYAPRARMVQAIRETWMMNPHQRLDASKSSGRR
jgi:hypothetical protein